MRRAYKNLLVGVWTQTQFVLVISDDFLEFVNKSRVSDVETSKTTEGKTGSVLLALLDQKSRSFREEHKASGENESGKKLKAKRDSVSGR